jgi:uncharacterized protein (PEP-CTERM system associated)
MYGILELLADMGGVTRRFFGLGVFLGFFLSGVAVVEAGEWDLTPRITLGAGYSDNIDLTPHGDSDMLGEATPGFSLHGKSARLNADIDYQMQNVFFVNHSQDSSSYNQLNSRATAELAKDLFFVDGSANAGQAVVNTNRSIPVGNLNAANNTSNFVSYSLGPRLQSHLGGYADAKLRYRYSQVMYDNNGASDATINEVDANLASGQGRLFKELTWSVNSRYLKQNSDSNNNSSTSGDGTYRNTDGEARYRLSQSFSLVGQAGYSDNNYQTSNQIENGSYWGLGGAWQPSRFYSLQALTGNNLNTATVGLYPTHRTSLVVTYRDQQVGLPLGKTWNGSFTHHTRRTNWNAQYSEEITTQQQLTSQTNVTFLGIDPITGQVNPNPQPGDLLVSVPTEVTSLTNETIKRKRGSGSVGMRTGKSGLLFTVWNEKREGQETGDNETTTGISGNWNRRLASRTNSVFTASWQKIQNDQSTNNGDQNLWYLQEQLVRQIGPRTQGSLELRHTVQDSGNSRSGYTENLIFARVTRTF